MCEACVETVNNIPMEFLQLMEDRKAEFTALINSLGSDAHKAFTIEVMHVDGVTTLDSISPEERAEVETEMHRVHGVLTMACLFAWHSIIACDSKEQAHSLISNIIMFFNQVINDALAYKCVSQMPKN